MTAVETLDEDELLKGSAFSLDNVDEDALLGPISRTTTTEFDLDIAERELLGEKPGVKEEAASCPDGSFEREELDYDEDEDEDKEERVGRFTSERNKQATPSTIPNKDNSAIPIQKKGGELKKTWNNNNRGGFNNRGRMNQWNPRGGNMAAGRGRGGFVKNFGGPPSLLSMHMEPPVMLNGQNGGKILVNPNFVPGPPQPLVRLNIPGAPPISMGPPLVPNMSVGNQAVGPIVPRLPNGIPLVPLPNHNLPPNHGMAGFGNNNSHRHHHSHNPASMFNNGGWDQQVEEFINGGFRTSKRRSESYSSRSGSSSYSGSSRSRSRSRSRSPRRHQRSSFRKHRYDKESKRGERNSRGRRGGRGVPGNRRYDRSDKPRRNDKGEVAAECAKVVGVDKDYLSRVEEQKRLREEMMRMKEQRRHGHEERRAEQPRMKSEPGSSTASTTSKKKAFLCVNVKNLKQLPTALNRVETLAKEVGTVKKVWQFNDDQVNIIFTELEKAKGFMLKYNNKVLSGLRIQVSLEKAYLSLAEVQG
ncbi:unnamed protein product [Auanema sp. JU1783]|nr:unnamed protein product [Auanema sp. JU1783]